MEDHHICELAGALKEAENSQRPIEPLTKTWPSLNVDDAYKIQLTNIAEKVASGDEVVGKKIGLTSRAMQEMFSVNEPDYGHLLQSMIHVEGEKMDISQLIQPKIETEIAFILGSDLRGPNVTPQDVFRATDYIVPAFEVIDSRITDWKITFEDTVADNGSSAKAVLGSRFVSLKDVNPSLTGMTLFRNGKQVATAAGAAVMGDPLLAVSWLANAVSRYDIALHAGEVVLSGALTSAMPVEEGDVYTACFDHLGEVTLEF